jgi:hypothetical protein
VPPVEVQAPAAGPSTPAAVAPAPSGPSESEKLRALQELLNSRTEEKKKVDAMLKELSKKVD